MNAAQPTRTMLQAFLAAALFGASAPLAKVLLGEIEPILLAALLYLGSGLGVALWIGLRQMRARPACREAAIRRGDVGWLAGAVVAGGVAAPIALLFGLRQTPAATASLLLNLEGVATAIIAAWMFKEAIGSRVGWAVALITLASVGLTWPTSGQWGVTVGALGVVGACVLWGIDNNLTRHIAAKDPLMIVAVKGFVAGGFSAALGVILRQPLPTPSAFVAALLLGSVSYGLSIVLFILAMRDFGAARTSAVFGLGPFFGAGLSVLLLHERPGGQFFAAIPLMVAGVYLLLTEHHAHEHVHEPIEHDHAHRHDDGHHLHPHEAGEIPRSGWRSHPHRHEPLRHSHRHAPDLHHRHAH